MTTATSTDPTLELQRLELAELITRHAGDPHGPASAIAGLYLVRYTENVRSVPTLAQPALCILAQGSKACSSATSSTPTTRCTTWWSR